MARKGFRYAHVSSYIHEAPYQEDKRDKILDYYKEALLRKGGGVIVFHEMRFRDGDPSVTDKRWLPSTVEEFILWARAEGFTFTLYP